MAGNIHNYNNNSSSNPFEGLSQMPPGRYDVRFGRYTYTVTVRDNADQVNFNCPGRGASHGVNPNYNADNYNGIDVTVSLNNTPGLRTSTVTNRNEAMNLIAKEFNIQKPPTYIGYSLNGVDAVRMAGDYAKKHPNQRGMMAVAIEASTNDSPKNMGISNEQRKALIDNDALLLNVYNKDVPTRSITRGKNLDYYKGVHILDIEVEFRDKNGKIISGKTGGHGIIDDWLFKSGISDLGSGNFDFNNLKTSFKDSNGNTYTVDLSKIVFREHYVDENGNYVSRKITLQEANSLLLMQLLKSKYLIDKDISKEDMEFYEALVASNDVYLSNWLIQLYQEVNKLNTSDINISQSGNASVIEKEVALAYKIDNIKYEVVNKFKTLLTEIAKAGLAYKEVDKDLEGQIIGGSR